MMSSRALVAMFVVAFAARFSSGQAIVLTDQQIVGDWDCATATMHGPNFDLDVSTRTTNRPDHTSVSITTAVITIAGKEPMTNIDETQADWKVDGDLIIVEIHSVRFVSSSDPSFDLAEGQAIHDAELKKKSIYKSRVLSIDNGVLRHTPVDSMYPEAAVESTCKRVHKS